MSVRAKLCVLACAVGAIVIGVAGAGRPASARPAEAPAQQATPKCDWRDVGNLNRSVAYAASAMDTTNGVMYVYGGYSDPSAQFQTQSAISTITFGATLTAGDTKVAALSVSGAPDREALAGVYRPKGDDSAIYWIAGRNNSGDTNNDVYEYKIKTKAWSRLATTGAFGDRDEHVAAYDPKHDVIWVAAGESKACTSVPCQAPAMPTHYLQFDATTGAASWHDGPSGGPRAKGPTMVYDAKKERMLVFGGTPDGSKGTDGLWALDLSDADVTKAKWAEVKPAGTGPSVAVHGAAYDAERNWMVVYGGMKTNYAVGNKETGETRTFALDLNVDPPMWRNLGSTVGDRIQPVMEYLPQHKAVVMTSGRVAILDPVQDQFTKRTIHALVCAAVVEPTATTPHGPRPTDTPGTGPQPTAMPTPTLNASPDICESVKSRVPPAVLNAAAGAPNTISGYGQPCNPNLPAGPLNPLRRFLNLQNPSVRFHPLYNGVVWKCGCQ